MKKTTLERSMESAQSRPAALLVALLLGGLAVGLFWWHYRHENEGGAANSLEALAGGGLSENTLAILKNLEVPVTVRFYSVLDQASVPAETLAFADHIQAVLAEYERAAAGKISLARLQNQSDADSAAADGIQPFNLDKGNACFLGVSLTGGRHSEALARLEPEWASALEADLDRALLRVAGPAAPARLAPEVARPSPETLAAIHRLIPDVNAVSTEQAGQIFSAEYLKQCAVVGAAAEAQVNAAAQQVVQAQNGGSAADLAAAQKQLAQAELAQGQRLKDLAAQLSVEQAVFQQMKAAATNAAK